MCLKCKGTAGTGELCLGGELLFHEGSSAWIRGPLPGWGALPESGEHCLDQGSSAWIRGALPGSREFCLDQGSSAWMGNSPRSSCLRSCSWMCGRSEWFGGLLRLFSSALSPHTNPLFQYYLIYNIQHKYGNITPPCLTRSNPKLSPFGVYSKYVIKTIFPFSITKYSKSP